MDNDNANDQDRVAGRISFFEHLEALLRTNGDYVAEDGRLLRNKVAEAAATLDPALLRLLLSDAEAKKRFFAEVDGTEVFDKAAFGWMVENRAFLPDSFTRFKNRIGLADPNGGFLASAPDVVLSFPYKDCVLEGGQTKEDQKRREVFYNRILAPDEVDRLLEPKALCRAVRHDKDGAHPATAFDPATDNLVIKGNNLLALASLLPRYEGKVKLIYIDPPYNTGNDGFGYNDSFNHSTWLVFMKNRLEIARRLLREDGSIFISCDDNEQAYLKVLGDEIFGRDNFKVDFVWWHRKSSQNDIDVSLSHNYTLVFAKNATQCRFNPLPIDSEKFSNPDNDPRGPWVADPFDAPNVRSNLTYPVTNPNTGEQHLPPRGRHWRFSQEKFSSALAEGRIIFGKNGKGRPQYKRYQSDAEDKGVNPFTIWDDTGTATEATKELMAIFDGEKVFGTPKPEKLLARIFTIASNPGDIVLDFFLGSGTSAAVAHKMGRRYIGVEQLDYIEKIPIPRLEKIIAGEQGGVSETVGWTGGGSFVSCELASCNASLAAEIAAAADDAALTALLGKIVDTGYASHRVWAKDLKSYEADFEALGTEEKRQVLFELLDANMLYVARADMEDAESGLADADKAFTRSFYGE